MRTLHLSLPSFLLLLLLALVGCTSSGENQQAAEPDTRKIIYGLSITVSGIDPHINQSSELGIVLRQVYDTLVYRNPETDEFVPGLAESWEISEDGRVYTFHLRDDVTFHDGTPFNAAAVAANIDRITDPATVSQKARLLLGPIQSYQIVDEYTFRINLSEPYSPLLDSLSQVYLGMASPEALAEYSGEDLIRYQYHQVGTGPFEFVEYLPDSHIIIRRSPNYTWGPAFYEPVGENAVQEIEYRFFTDPATRALALENGDAHIMGELLPTDARALSSNSAIELQPVAVPGQPLQFYMNTGRPPTDQLALRQALLFAANRSSIVDAVYQGFSPAAWGPLSAETLFYNPGVVGVYDYDPEQAQELLTSLGYEDSDRDGILDRDGEPLSITLIQPAWGLVPEVTQLLRDQWQAVGIETIIDPVPGFTSLVEKVQSGEYNLVSFDTFGMDPAFLNPYFLSNGSVNWTGYGSAELDTLLIEASQSNDPSTRRQLYGRIQATIMQQALILPIRDYVNINAHVAAVDGLIYDSYGWFPLMHNVTIQGGG